MDLSQVYGSNSGSGTVRKSYMTTRLDRSAKSNVEKVSVTPRLTYPFYLLINSFCECRDKITSGISPEYRVPDGNVNKLKDR